MEAQLRYYYHIEPDELDDATFAARFAELEYIRRKEAEANKG